MSKTMLMVASVASMIKQFNMENISMLQNLGYQVHVAANFERGSTMNTAENQRFKKELQQLGVMAYQVDFPRGIGTPSALHVSLKQLSQVIQENDYHFIHCHSPFAGVCGRLVGHKYHIKVIYTAHGFQFFKGGSRLSWLTIYPVEKYLARYTANLIAINQEDFKLVKAKFHSQSTSYIPGVGINVARIQQVKIDRAAKRKSLGIPKDATVILSVGELNNNKNHAVVLEALGKLARKDIYYVICGIGGKQAALQEIARENNLSERFKLLGYRTDIVEIMKSADIFAFPSFREGLPVSLMEAMAAGLPVIASKIRGNTDLIEDGINGYLFDPTQSIELNQALNELLSNESLRQQFTINGLKRVQQFDTKVVKKIMHGVYQQLA